MSLLCQVVAGSNIFTALTSTFKHQPQVLLGSNYVNKYFLWVTAINFRYQQKETVASIQLWLATVKWPP